MNTLDWRLVEGISRPLAGHYCDSAVESIDLDSSINFPYAPCDVRNLALAQRPVTKERGKIADILVNCWKVVEMEFMIGAPEMGSSAN